MDYEFQKLNNIQDFKLGKKYFRGYDIDQKNDLEHNNNKKRVKRRKKKLHILRKLFIFIFTICVLCGFLGLGMIKGILDSTPPISSFHFGPTNFATNIYDRNGDLIDTLVKAGANRESVKFKDIPTQIINAFVAIEDERFWEHSGIDRRSIFRAIYGVLFSDSSRGGGSTITQQLVKNSVFNNENYSAFNEKGFEKYVRKLQEQYIAFLYENQESMSKKEIKEQIITDYLNIINLGSNTLGIKVAIKKYFDKEVEDLQIKDTDGLKERAKKINEAAVIASITKNPSKNNPVTHPEENDKRRRQVLLNMKNQNYITNDEYKAALDDDVYRRIKNVDTTKEIGNTAYSYFTDALIDQVIEALQKSGYTYTLASNLLYSGGLSIYTTEDSKIQKIVDKHVNDESNYKVKKYSIDYRLSILHKNGTQTHYSQQDIDKYYKETLKDKKYDGLFKDITTANDHIKAFKKYIMTDDDSIAGETVNYVLEPQCSFVIMDHKTGEVVAIAGGRGEKTVSRGLNRATNTLRQPGSTFKVITSFAPALELYNKTLANVYYDSEYTYKDKEFKNWYSKGYLGYQNIRNGIIYSLNIIAARCLIETVSPEKGIEFAERFGITSLVKSGKLNDVGPSLALGGLTKGVSNLELTSAFSAIANEGLYNKPKFFTKIIDHDGNVIIDNTNKPTYKRVMSKQNAFLLTDAMKQSLEGRKCYAGTLTVNSTSTRASFKGMSIAGKSGTTTNNVDVWFVGFTPYYTAGVWGGLDENQTLQDTKLKINNGGTNYHKDIWKKIMQEIHAGLKNTGFNKPNGIVTRDICIKCGKLATDKCKLDQRGDATYKEYFVDGTQPKKNCTCHDNEGYMIIEPKYAGLLTDDAYYININNTVIPNLPGEENINQGHSNVIIAPSPPSAPIVYDQDAIDN